jgi:YVTN family beta-propeller protein
MPSSSEVLSTIPVGMQPRWIAISPTGTRAYVTLEEFQADGPDTGGVAVIDTGTNTVTATITLGSHPSGVVITPDGRHAYVPNWDSSHGRGVVSVIDTHTSTVVDSITVSGLGGGPNGVAITPNGRHVYVATDHELATAEDQGKVSVIDTATNTVLTSIRGNPFPSTMTITPNGDFAYVLDNDGNPQVIDTATHEVSFPLEGVISNGRIAFTPDGLHAYVVSEGSDLVQVLEVATHSLVAVVDVFGGHSTDVAVTGDGHQVCVTQRAGKALRRPVWVIETATQKVTGSPVKWSGSADGLAITPDGSAAYVADRQSRAVQVVPLQPRTA